MRVGAIADKGIHRADQLFADIAMKVMGAQDRHHRSHNGAQHRRHGAITILIACRATRAMIGDIDTIQGQSRRQAGAHFIQRVVEQALINGAARRCSHFQNRHRHPGPGFIHTLVETRNLGGQMADRLPREPRYRLTPFQALAGEIFLDRDWREGICFQMQPQNGNARCARRLLTHFCNNPRDRRVA